MAIYEKSFISHYIVIADCVDAGKMYRDIIHQQDPWAICITWDEIQNDLLYGYRSVQFKSSFFVDGEYYFLFFPSKQLNSANSFWQNHNITYVVDGLQLHFIKNVSVWSLYNIDIPQAFVPYIRVFTNKEQLEESLKAYIRAQKQINTKNIQSISNNQTIFYTLLDADNIQALTIMETHISRKAETSFNSYTEMLENGSNQKQIIIQERPVLYNNTNVKYMEASAPMITIFSSSEADAYVKLLCDNLRVVLNARKTPANVGTWRERAMWGTGKDTISALIQYAKEVRQDNGYVVFFFAPDDYTVIRGKECFVSRDNVWLEYGLFSAAVSPTHVFTLFPHNPVQHDGKNLCWHTPTDFVTQYLEYTYSDNIETVKDRINLIAHDIIDIIERNNIQNQGATHSTTDGNRFRFTPYT